MRKLILSIAFLTMLTLSACDAAQPGPGKASAVEQKAQTSKAAGWKQRQLRRQAQHLAARRATKSAALRRRTREEAQRIHEESAAIRECHESYVGACLDPSTPDYDCAGGSGDGPGYTGPVTVVGYDEYDLDRDGDGYACE